MRTIPAGIASALLSERPDLRAAVRSCGRIVGQRIELDLDAVAGAVSVDLAELLVTYYDRCENLWASVQAGHSGPAYAMLRRPLLEHQQVTGKKGRADLGDVYEALGELPGVAELLEQITAPAPDADVLASMVATVGGTVTFPEPDAVRAQLCLEGRYAYPQLLGGVPWPGEIRRVLTLLTRQAAWRDRRVRRLAKVDVAVDELWAAPADLAAAVRKLPAHPGPPCAA
jgi:hypothetical protein